MDQVRKWIEETNTLIQLSPACDPIRDRLLEAFLIARQIVYDVFFWFGYYDYKIIVKELVVIFFKLQSEIFSGQSGVIPTNIIQLK